MCCRESWHICFNSYFIFSFFSQHPYPSEDQKKQLAQDTGLTILQVNNWWVPEFYLFFLLLHCWEGTRGAYHRKGRNGRIFLFWKMDDNKRHDRWRLVVRVGGTAVAIASSPSVNGHVIGRDASLMRTLAFRHFPEMRVSLFDFISRQNKKRKRK